MPPRRRATLEAAADKIDTRHALATTRYRAEDAVRAAKVGDYDRTRQMLLAALRALPPKEAD